MIKKIGVIGLGYVGLPLAVELAKKYTVTGFDINSVRVQELMDGKDRSLETDVADLLQVITTGKNKTGLFCSDKPSDLADCDCYIITVPTPTDKYNHPDLTLLFNATELVGAYLKKGDLVIYESTVYPGVTEEECAPMLEKKSGLIFNRDFFCGYSPERINTGDKVHTITKVLKITSGSTPETADKVDSLYRSIIVAGTHMTSSIKIAEAAKVIENSQRDINIAFVNELAKIFNLLDIDTTAVLEAAGTKWNFIKFSPGLVGGHCIGVDPYYLAQKAQQAGYQPEIILAGRRLNDGMGAYVASETIKLMIRKEIPIKNAGILILGFTFKENCNDIRNTRVIDIINELKTYQTNISVCDPRADPATVLFEYGIETTKTVPAHSEKYDAVIVAVAHDEFRKINIRTLVREQSVIYDVKGILNADSRDARL